MLKHKMRIFPFFIVTSKMLLGKDTSRLKVSSSTIPISKGVCNVKVNVKGWGQLNSNL